MARVLLPQLAKFTLDHVAKTVGVSLENHHRAVDDAEATAEIFEKFIPMLLEKVHMIWMRLMSWAGQVRIMSVKHRLIMPLYWRK